MHGGFSAPASVAFLVTVPFLTGIALFTVLSLRFNKKYRSQRVDQTLRR